MKILPAIDLQNGRCVRLLKGDFKAVTQYNNDPLNQAKIFKSNELNYLHIVDLDGAESGNQMNKDVIAKILEIPDISIQVGGGIRTIQQVENMLEIGVSRIILGTALFQKNFIQDLKKNFDSSQIVLALDFKIINNIPTIYTHGWQDNSEIPLYQFISDQPFYSNILATDISLDGAMLGPSFSVYKDLLHLFPSINLIASGGIRSLNDLNKLKLINIQEAIIGKAIYEKNISLRDLDNDY
ncbi:1-(5-phosphoribosyl)-5-[(5-phosphoribosylamino)methylideneamino] imidazole-4-carboxamide isomerase [Gammaproteobacteria bacterium]|nr:1-(5-phosphoribosyl)-5-[(5-phosphoribosylamino)methylideneamino] imidazole-4-carboxamide isomerase [Gammaproteobacteria bacterium]MDC1131192.1 1-(5-phosphoribosyl)-5-[(5-phosphoribosylamino)methylideneamino] imidazole-4-carboxamide isomerase [Gammaproteobacteria bacterium]